MGREQSGQHDRGNGKTSMVAEQQVAMDGSPATTELFNCKNADPQQKAQLLDGGRTGYGPFGEIKWQLGPVQEVGVNGTTIEDVIEVCITRLRGFQAGPFASRENALAITDLESARNWLLQRTRARQEQGVEGTNRPHRD